MSRKVLDSNIGDNEIESLMDNIIAQNPQLNAQIEKVHNENNSFLCKVLRIYPYEDKAYVKILNNNRKMFCRLSHEVMCSSISMDYLPKGHWNVDNDKLKSKSYIVPFDNLYGVIVRVRWLNLDDEYVLFGYVNIHDDYDLKTNCDTGEICLKSGSSIISVDDKRINIMTPNLFINGLPYDEPELKNYYNKTESNIINNSLQKNIDSDFDTNSENSLMNKIITKKINELEERIKELEEK